MATEIMIFLQFTIIFYGIQAVILRFAQDLLPGRAQILSEAKDDSAPLTMTGCMSAIQVIYFRYKSYIPAYPSNLSRS